MDIFIQRFAGKIKGFISGFDRIVFKGCLRPLMFADEAMAFLRSRGVLNKDYKVWVMAQSEALVEAANNYARSTGGRKIIRKIPCQRKSALTDQGRTLTTALNAMLAASTQQLMEIAA